MSRLVALTILLAPTLWCMKRTPEWDESDWKRAREQVKQREREKKHVSRSEPSDRADARGKGTSK